MASVTHDVVGEEAPVVVVNVSMAGSQGGGVRSGGLPSVDALVAGLKEVLVSRTGGDGGGRNRADGLNNSLDELAPQCNEFVISKGIEDGEVVVADGPADPGGQKGSSPGGWCLIGSLQSVRGGGPKLMEKATGKEEEEVGSRKKKRSAPASMEESSSTDGIGGQFPDPIME